MKVCLVVDDSRVIRQVARKMLETLQFSVREAENGQVALDACDEGMPDAILLDWNMPVLNGIDFLRQLRRLPEGRKPRVVFCTTENDLERVREAVEAGADEYVMKPFDHEILRSKFAHLGLIAA